MNEEIETRGTGFEAFTDDVDPRVPVRGPRWLASALNALDRVLLVVLTLMMTVMLLAAIAQVAARYVLETALVGPEEIARYMMIGGTFLALPVLARRRNHIAVDALAHYIPDAGRVWLERLVLLVELTFLVLFTWYAALVVEELRVGQGFSAGLELPAWIPMLPVALGAGLGLVVTAVLLVQTFVPGGTDTVRAQEVTA